jgi:hypothetical protein
MNNITSVAGLRSAIQELQVEQSVKGRLLKDNIYLIQESLKPVNLLRDALKETFSSDYLAENLSGTIMGATSGFLLKKIFIGKSANKLTKLVGAVFQLGITNLIAQNSDQIKSLARALFQHFFRRKEIDTARHIK